jgi:hypothetical protein
MGDDRTFVVILGLLIIAVGCIIGAMAIIWL